LTFVRHDSSSALGPFGINGVPLRRVNQSYVIATSASVDISKANIDAKFDDAYFKRPEAAAKASGEFFEEKKEVGFLILPIVCPTTPTPSPTFSFYHQIVAITCANCPTRWPIVWLVDATQLSSCRTLLPHAGYWCGAANAWNSGIATAHPFPVHPSFISPFTPPHIQPLWQLGQYMLRALASFSPTSACHRRTADAACAGEEG